MANYPQNTNYMQQQHQQQQQQMSHQRALFMQQQQHAMLNQQMPDGSIRQNIPPHMLMQPGQRPPTQQMQQRMMLMTSQQQANSQAQHNLQMQQQQQSQHRAMLLNQQHQQQQQQQARQMMAQQNIPVSQQQPQQHYSQYNPGVSSQRQMVPSPMKMPPQQLKPEGMRTPIHMGQQQMIIRSSTPGGGYESMPQQVIIQQQQSQQQQQNAPTSSSQVFTTRSISLNPNHPQIIQTRPQSQPPQFIRNPNGSFQRIIRPGEIEMQGGSYVIRTTQNPQGGYAYAHAIPTSSGEPQYQIIQQSQPTFVQTQGPGQHVQTVRTIRPIQQQQQSLQQQTTPLRMALAQPPQGNIVMQPVVVSGEGVTIIDGGVITSSSSNAGITQVTLPTNASIQNKQQPIIITRPPITTSTSAITVVPSSATPAKTTPSKLPSKKGGGSSKSKAKPALSSQPQKEASPPASSIIKKSSEPPATVLAPQTKLILSSHLDSIIATSKASESLELSVKNAVNEFAETYAEFLLDELVDAVRLRKVAKIENRDAKFVILRETNKEKECDGKKK